MKKNDEDARRRAQLLAAAEELEDPSIASKVEEEDAHIAAAQELSRRNAESDLPPWRRGTHNPTRPWELINSYRKDLLGVAPAPSRNGYVHRWCRSDELERKVARGWQIADGKHYSITERVVGEETRLEPGIVRRREMVLVEMPQSWYDDILQAKKEANDLQRGKSKRDIEGAAQETGTKLYDPRGS